MRVYLLYIVIFALAAYAWRDWFVSLCGLIVLTGITGNPDFPLSIMGIQGLNPWNVLLAMVTLAWLARRRDEGLHWDLPRVATVLWLCYLLTVVVAFVRAAFDYDSFPPQAYHGTLLSFFSDELINPLKYLIPAIMLFDGCRTRRRLVQALVAIMLVVVVYSAMLIKHTPIGTLIEGGDYMRTRIRVGRAIGFHVINLAMLAAATFWGIIGSLPLWKTLPKRLLMLGAAGIVGLALLLTYSRAGYLAVLVIGLCFALLCRRRLLLLLVPMVIAVPLVAPTIWERTTMGVSGDVGADTNHDWDVISSGRMTHIWPPVVDQISEAPLLGQGRAAILRGSARDRIAVLEGGSGFTTHPHCAYLEILLDSGLVGLACVLMLFGGILWMSSGLLRVSGDSLPGAIGALSFAMVIALLAMGVTAHSFFPQPEMMAMWCAWAIALRSWLFLKAAGPQRPLRQTAYLPAARPRAWSR